VSLVAMRLAPLGAGDFDAAVCLLPTARFIRLDRATFLECLSELEDDARVLLARAGVGTGACERLPDAPAHLIPARAAHLDPVLIPGAVDSLVVRVLGMGEAADRLRQRRALGRGRFDVDRVRAVLRGDDRLIAWRRVLWADRAAFRTRSLQGIRPVVFDRDGIDDGVERWTPAGAGALARWLCA
jgi:hypothetical protein